MGALRLQNLAVLLVVISGVSCWDDYDPYEFPDGFLFGVATAAYQTEGAWNASGKGVNIWDEFTHDHLDRIAGHIGGDVADDGYHQHKRDVEILSDLGVNFYRFSISWSRVLPTGFIDKPNPAGIKYYHSLIDELLAKGIEPMVTMYHWDLPEPLQDLGGFANVKLVDYFEDYADFLYKTYGDKVKTWITFNEPNSVCVMGYGIGSFAPGISSSGVGDYLCTHTLLLSHARAYRHYDTKYRAKQNGRVGIVINMMWIEPKTKSKDDREVAETARQFEVGIYSHAIFSKDGDYPPVVKKIVAAHSKAEGLKRSRLPVFTEQQLKDLKGSADFFGLNYYSTFLASKAGIRQPMVAADLMAELAQDASWPSSAVTWWLQSYPLGMRKVLNWLKSQYGDIEIIITENGYSTDVGLHDPARIKYLQDHLQNVLDAIDDGVNVTGYTIWSLEDNFEWLGGYKQRFGIYETNYNSPNRTRTARDSARYYKDVILTGLLDPSQEDIEYAQS